MLLCFYGVLVLVCTSHFECVKVVKSLFDVVVWKYLCVRACMRARGIPSEKQEDGQILGADLRPHTWKEILDFFF